MFAPNSFCCCILTATVTLTDGLLCEKKSGESSVLSPQCTVDSFSYFYEITHPREKHTETNNEINITKINKHADIFVYAHSYSSCSRASETRFGLKRERAHVVPVFY